MTPETKKRLLYGSIIVAAGGVGIWLWKRQSSQVPSGDSASSTKAQAEALANEQQMAAIASLGGSGSQLSSPNIGSHPVQDFGQEINAILKAAGLEPVQTTPGTGATPASNPTETTQAGTVRQWPRRIADNGDSVGIRPVHRVNYL